jgi:hypothetical protein
MTELGIYPAPSMLIWSVGGMIVYLFPRTPASHFLIVVFTLSQFEDYAWRPFLFLVYLDP